MLIREVASAICRANGGCPLNPGTKITSMTSGTGIVDYNDKEWEDYIPQAKAAMSAISDWAASIPFPDFGEDLNPFILSNNINPKEIDDGTLKIKLKNVSDEI